MIRKLIREVAPNISHVAGPTEGSTLCGRNLKTVSQTYDADENDVSCPECLEELTRRHPRAFLSHSSEDKGRFVKGFAERLRKQGVDVWYDDWELLPGDSLVDKIFEEGLSQAEIFLIVVSQHSVASPWVKEELNAAVVRRIEQHCKLIPVVLDGVEVPDVLRHTVRQEIANPEDYSAELDKIVRAIYGMSEKPSLGAPPSYTMGESLPGLQLLDTRILQVAGEMALHKDEVLLASRDLLDALETDQVSEDAFLESLEILEGRGYVHVVRTFGRGLDGMSAFSLSTWGLDQFAQAFLPDYAETISGVAAHLVNSGGGEDGEIARELHQPRALVENVLDLFVAQGLIRATKTTGPSTYVHWVSPELWRLLQ
jgi:hypothetical protein